MDWDQPSRILTLFNQNFSPLAGIFGLGYFLHPCSLPIVRSAARPENSQRDLFLGYLFVFISYILLGSLGYIGFVGYDFASYFESKIGTATEGQIDQNCLNMFDYADVAAFILRLAIFLLLFSGYPLVHFFVLNSLLKLFYGDEEVSRLGQLVIGWCIIIVNLMFALFYPNIGTVLSYAGAICGFVIVYLLPVMVHLAQSREEIDLKLRGQVGSDSIKTDQPMPYRQLIFNNGSATQSAVASENPNSSLVSKNCSEDDDHFVGQHIDTDDL